MKSNVLAETSAFLHEISKKEFNNPSTQELHLYILAKEFGITKLEEYSVAYLNSLLSVYSHVKKLEEQEVRRARKK